MIDILNIDDHKISMPDYAAHKIWTWKIYQKACKGLIVNRLFDMGKRFVMKNGRTSSPPLRLEWLGS